MGVVTKKSGRRTKATFVQVGFAALVVIGVALAFAFTQGQATGASATAPQTTQQMTLIGASTIHSTPLGSGAVANPETMTRDGEGDGPGIKPGLRRRCCRSAVCHYCHLVIEDATASRESSYSEQVCGRPGGCSARPNTSSSAFPPPEPNVPGKLRCRFSGAGICRIQRTEPCGPAAANNGNQFSLEPPDQGLCAGNGFVIETVNDVIQVYNTRAACSWVWKI